MPDEVVLLTYVVACYNVERFVRTYEKTLQSLCEINGLEFLFIDDGSTDSTPSLLDAVCKTLPRCRVIHKENGGHGSVINAGSSAAKGKYFAILDADDYLDCDEVAEMLSKLASSSSDLILIDYFKDFVADGTKTRFRCFNTPEPPASMNEYEVSLPGVLVNRTFYSKTNANIIEKAYYDDIVWTAHLCAHATSAAYLPLAPYHYVMWGEGQSVSLASHAKHLDDRILVQNEILKIWDSANEQKRNRCSILARFVKSSAINLYHLLLIIPIGHLARIKEFLKYDHFLKKNYPEIRILARQDPVVNKALACGRIRLFIMTRNRRN